MLGGVVNLLCNEWNYMNTVVKRIFSITNGMDSQYMPAPAESGSFYTSGADIFPCSFGIIWNNCHFFMNPPLLKT